MYKKGLSIPDNHTLIETNSKWSERKGNDTDTYWYDETDENDNIIAKYIVKDSTCIYPPQKRTILFEKFTPDGKLIKNGKIDKNKL